MELSSTLVERATHLVGTYLAPTMADLGITQGEAHVLAQLGRSGASPIGTLHREFGTKRSTLTSILDRLEERGLVRREPNPADRRSFLVSLTATGSRAAARVGRALGVLERQLAASVGPDDLAALGRIVHGLEEIAGR